MMQRNAVNDAQNDKKLPVAIRHGSKGPQYLHDDIRLLATNMLLHK